MRSWSAVPADGRSVQREDLFVRFLGWYENAECVFIAIEYIKHGDLSQYLTKPRSSAANARVITIQLLEGLAILHELKICHRDVKPKVRSLTTIPAAYSSNAQTNTPRTSSLPA